jgi:chemotaxis signal transduction protein
MNPPTESAEKPGHTLLVRSGGARCAIPVQAAKLVTHATTVHPLPGAAKRFLGLAQIAGEAVAVVDLRALLEPDAQPAGGHELHVVVARRGSRASLGLAVDEALGVVRIEVDRPATGDDPEWISGRGRWEGKSVVVLDPEPLLSTVETG